MNGKKTISTEFSFLKLVLLFALPSIFLLLILLVTWTSFRQHNIDLIANTYYNELLYFSSDTERKISNIQSEAKKLEDNDYFLATLNNSSDYETQKKAIALLSDFVNSNDLIHSAQIVNLQARTVLTTTGTFSLSEYFAASQTLNDNFWDSYNPIYNFTQNLPPHIWSAPDTPQTAVITTILSPWGNIKSNSLLIVNIEIDEGLSTLDDYLLTGNTSLLLLDKKNMNLFAVEHHIDEKTLQCINSPEFLTGFLENKNYAYTYRIYGEKWLFIKSTSHIPAKNCLYFIAVPYNDIYDLIPQLPMFIVLIIIILSTLSMIFIFRNAIKVYNSPSAMQQLFSATLKKLSNSNVENLRVLNNKTLETSVKNIISEKDDYSTALTILKENFLSDIIFNKTNNSILDKNHQTVFQNKIVFENSCFAVIAFCFNFDYDINPNEQSNNDLRRAIRYIFPQSYDLFLIKEPKTERYYIILNFENEDSQKEILEYFSKFKETFENENKYISISFAISEICIQMDKIVYSYNEARNLLIKSQYTLDSNEDSNLRFTANDESLLLNYLLSGRIDNAASLIQKFIDKFNSSINSDETLKCYTAIISLIFKVMYAKNITYKSEYFTNESDAIASIVTCPQNEIKQFISERLEELRTCFNTKVTKLNIQEIVEYIAQNYNQILSLDIIAERFAVNPSYLSRTIKQHLGDNFTEYLSKIRVRKAQELLVNTDLQINTIATNVGFSSRSSFLRAFKAYCGITPTEYRHIEYGKEKLN